MGITIVGSLVIIGEEKENRNIPEFVSAAFYNNFNLPLSMIIYTFKSSEYPRLATMCQKFSLKVITLA